jgi:hypothetical protein
MPITQVAFTPLGGYFSVCVTALDIGEVFYSDGWDKAGQNKADKAAMLMLARIDKMRVTVLLQDRFHGKIG